MDLIGASLVKIPSKRSAGQNRCPTQVAIAVVASVLLLAPLRAQQPPQLQQPAGAPAARQLLHLVPAIEELGFKHLRRELTC
jgi:hypothetical protein